MGRKLFLYKIWGKKEIKISTSIIELFLYESEEKNISEVKISQFPFIQLHFHILNAFSKIIAFNVFRYIYDFTPRVKKPIFIFYIFRRSASLTHRQRNI